MDSDESDSHDFEVVERTSAPPASARSLTSLRSFAPAPAPAGSLFGSSSGSGSTAAAVGGNGATLFQSFGATLSSSVAFGSARSAAAPPPAAPISARVQSQQVQQQQFKPVDLTKEMAETYYWGRQDQAVVLTGQQDVNAFWLEYVEWDEAKGGSFLSQVQFTRTSMDLFLQMFIYSRLTTRIVSYRTLLSILQPSQTRWLPCPC
jgi:hypothetical protein